MAWQFRVCRETERGDGGEREREREEKEEGVREKVCIGKTKRSSCEEGRPKAVPRGVYMRQFLAHASGRHGRDHTCLHNVNTRARLMSTGA